MPYVVKASRPALPKGHFAVRHQEHIAHLGKNREIYEETPLIRDYAADILFYRDSDDYEDEPHAEVIGNIEFISIPHSVSVNGTVHELADEHSNELATMASWLYDEEGDWKELGMDDGTPGDILYIRTMRLEPSWRGYGIGLLALDGLITSIPSFDMASVIMSPASMTRDVPESVADGPELRRWHDNAVQRLTRYYGLMGFGRYGPRSDSRCELLGFWFGRIRAPIETVVPHLF